MKQSLKEKALFILASNLEQALEYKRSEASLYRSKLTALSTKIEQYHLGIQMVNGSEGYMLVHESIKEAPEPGFHSIEDCADLIGRHLTHVSLKPIEKPHGYLSYKVSPNGMLELF